MCGRKTPVDYETGCISDADCDSKHYCDDDTLSCEELPSRCSWNRECPDGFVCSWELGHACTRIITEDEKNLDYYIGKDVADRLRLADGNPPKQLMLVFVGVADVSLRFMHESILAILDDDYKTAFESMWKYCGGVAALTALYVIISLELGIMIGEWIIAHLLHLIWRIAFFAIGYVFMVIEIYCAYKTAKLILRGQFAETVAGLWVAARAKATDLEWAANEFWQHLGERAVPVTAAPPPPVVTPDGTAEKKN